MKIVVRKSGLQHLRRLEANAGKLASGEWRKEAHRGVIDAGRKVKTKVQRAVHKQAAFKGYQADVVQHMRQAGDEDELTVRIFGVRGGQTIEHYKGLRVLNRSGKAARGLQEGVSSQDRGSVASSVWNTPRIFKRSFATERGHFALLPPGSGSADKPAPKAFWTFGAKKDQPRDDTGRFAKRGIVYGKMRRLYGPSLHEELVQNESAATFQREGPVFLEKYVISRMKKFIKI